MGNHEYCIDCGESDFHNHRPCDPEKVKIKRDQEEQFRAENQRRVMNMEKKLKGAGLDYTLNGTQAIVYS